MSENNRRFVPLAKSVVIEYVEITGSVPKNATVITKTSIPTGSNINPSEEFIKITSTNKVYRLVAKQPSIYDSTNKPNGIKFGEVAVNFKQDFEALFISNNSNDILKFTPIKEEIDLYETSQKAATTMAVNEFVLPVEVTYTPSATLSYAVNENEVYFPSSSTGISTLNLTVNAHNLNQDFVRPATFYFKTGSNGCTVNLLGAALDGVYGVADPSNIRLIENSTYRVIVKDKRAFIECAIPVLSRVGHGDGIAFRNVADTQDKETLDGGGIIKLKTATTTEKGGVKVYSTKNTSVSAATTPTSPKTNRDYGLEVGGDDKAYVYVPWEDTKNTAGTMNTSDKIYIVGSKTKATTAANDNKQTNTNGENYIDGDGWLCTDGQKVLVDANLDFIRDALASMEEWPSVETETTVSPQPVCYLTTNPVPNSVGNYYSVTNGSIAENVSNGKAYRAGRTLVTRGNISVNTTATFYPSEDVTYTATNRIYGMNYGYKDTYESTTKHTETEKKSIKEIPTECNRTDVSKTSDTKIEIHKKVNNGEYTVPASANNSGANTTITINSGTVLGTLEEGTTKLVIKYTNPSTISRTGTSGNVEEITAYYSSNINNFKQDKKTTIQTKTVAIDAVNTKYAEGSSNGGVKEGGVFTIYGVYPLFTNGSKNQAEPITGDDRTNGKTEEETVYNEFESLLITQKIKQTHGMCRLVKSIQTR